MPVKRRVNKRRDVVITPRAVELFREMKSLGRRCVCGGNDDCSACSAWWDYQACLSDELALPPWVWPCIRPTLGECSDRPWAGLNQSWMSQRELWRALEHAARELRAAQPAENGHGASLGDGDEVRADG
jgi:hypothetical protein